MNRQKFEVIIQNNANSQIQNEPEKKMFFVKKLEIMKMVDLVRLLFPVQSIKQGASSDFQNHNKY